MEDIKKTANEQAAEETKEAVKVVTDSDTPEGAYVHEFTKPYTFEEKTYTKLVFDFEKLIGDDLVAIENEMAAVGEYALSPEISTSFLYRLAAKAAGVGSDVIAHMPIRDFGKIKNKSRDFLISTGF
ncbi:phage tail assembly protein [[Clostridium] symbiosum]|uniref:phage tail assembly protein n=1 Tax=Clostridium symbiosum TaxID=1512 RepID=UPI0013623078|nr:phage tail assembly protein [Enterocloster clostridioformis]NBH16645.1 phage tail assembly protein [Clostridiaceae bacterium]